MIGSVEAGSPAASAGLEANDRILSLNGHPLRDVIDFQFYLESGANTLEIEREGKRLVLEMIMEDAGGGSGLTFSRPLFDRVRTCRCRCLFCFVDQVPRGMRKSLYLKDDDFRLSFLYGNFITLGNLSEDDITRILNQRLSPLRVSVHATDPAVRGLIMGTSPEEASQGLAVLRRLGEKGIRTHIQVVLCPGFNDGAVLERTVNDLADGYTNVESVGVVPVSVDPETLSRRSSSEPGPTPAGSARLRPVTPEDCQAVIRAVSTWQGRFRRECGTGFVYAADELYLRAGWPLPPLDAYDEMPQYENGVGIAAAFLAEAEGTVTKLLHDLGPRAPGRVFLLSGALAAGLMHQVCERLSHKLHREILPLVAENHTFGPHVTVTGLLGGNDVINAARRAGLGRGDLLLVPRSCLSDADESRFIDDTTLKALEPELGCEIIPLG